MDDDLNARRVAEALLLTATVPENRLFIDPLTDFDRTMDLTHGLIDTRCNPRPAMTVVRTLNTILHADGETWSVTPGDPMTIESATRRLCLTSSVPREASTLYGLTSSRVTETAQGLDDALLLAEYLK